MVERFWRAVTADDAAVAAAVGRVLPVGVMQEVFLDISRWVGYEATPLYSLDGLARKCGVSKVWYKDEAQRFGLGSFKALGGAYAVICSAVAYADAGGDVAAFTVATATDGNHGRAVAWGGKKAGCAVKIFVHKEVSEARVAAMAALGAEVIRVDGNYDESVRECRQQAEKNGWQIVSDTSWAGYTEVPRWVMAGYAVLVREVWMQLGGQLPTHIIMPAGVGTFAASVAAAVWGFGARPRLCVVESEHAACLLASARAGALTAVDVQRETVMAGLSCGEPSLLAWEVLGRTVSDFVAIGDEQVGAVMRDFAGGVYGGGNIEAGECSAAGVIALRELVGCGDVFDAGSRVLLFGTEGATDADSYRRLIGGDGEKA